MDAVDFSAIRIAPAPPEHWAEALRLVVSKLPEPLRGRHWEETLATFRRGEVSPIGLIEARRGDKALAAIWLQIQPGRVGNLWPPQFDAEIATLPQPAADLGRRLIDANAELAIAQNLQLVQALLETDSGSTADLLRQASFEPVADLLYLVCPPEQFPTDPPAGDLEFEPHTPAAEDRLAALIEQSYRGSRDCPQLNGVRSMDEILAGYRAVGRFEPSRWLLARRGGRDVGCILLSEHPLAVWELVYMGINPAERGQGFGMQMTRQAQWMASQGRAARLVVAVDAANEPAIRVYAAAGFKTWDKRTAWMRIFARAAPNRAVIAWGKHLRRAEKRAARGEHFFHSRDPARENYFLSRLFTLH